MNTNLGEVKVHACDCVSDPMTIKVKIVGMTQFRFRMAIVKRLFKLIRLIAPMSVKVEMEIEE